MVALATMASVLFSWSYRPERKSVPSGFPQPISWLWPAGPSLAMLAASEYRPQTRRERFFRTAKPVPSSALLASNIASIGGAGVRHGEDGGDVFFARDGLGCDGVALLCCVCGSVVWCTVPVVFVRRGYKQGYGETRWLRCPSAARATDGRGTLDLRHKPWHKHDSDCA